MIFSDIGLRHIVDVDGQLLGIDAEMIDPTMLLKRANRPSDSSLWMIHAGERVAVYPDQLIDWSRTKCSSSRPRNASTGRRSTWPRPEQGYFRVIESRGSAPLALGRHGTANRKGC
jgi:hypothetical protein